MGRGLQIYGRVILSTIMHIYMVQSLETISTMNSVPESQMSLKWFFLHSMIPSFFIRVSSLDIFVRSRFR